MKLANLVLCIAFVSTSAFAAGTHDCTNLDSIGNLAAPTKSFDVVKVAYVSTEEPAAAPDHVLVFVYDNEMGVSCTAISMDSTGSGFGYVDMNTVKSIGYDSNLGRLLQINVVLPSDGITPGKTQTIRFRANALTGKVTLE